MNVSIDNKNEHGFVEVEWVIFFECLVNMWPSITGHFKNMLDHLAILNSSYLCRLTFSATLLSKPVVGSSTKITFGLWRAVNSRAMASRFC